MKNKLLKIILAGMIAPIFVLAANVSIVFEKTPTLFSESSFMPGDSVTRWIEIENIGTQTKTVATQALNFANPTPNNDLSRALLINIKKNGSDFYGGSLGEKTLYDFYQKGLIDLAVIVPGEKQQYDYIISFPKDKENEWQGKSTYFDIQIGYSDGSDDPKEPIDDPKIFGGGGGGSSGGGCTNMIYKGSVKVTDITKNSAMITWKTTCLTDSEVVYSTEDDESNFDKTKDRYGYDNTTSVDKKLTDEHRMVLTGLKPCVKYFFRVASKDLIAISDQFSFTTPCDQEESPNPNDFGGPGEEQGNVAGASIKSPEPEVKGLANKIEDFMDNLGAKIPGKCSDNDILPWVLIIISGALSYIEYRKKEDLMKKINSNK